MAECVPTSPSIGVCVRFGARLPRAPKDLRRHEAEFERRLAFAYTVCDAAALRAGPTLALAVGKPSSPHGAPLSLSSAHTPHHPPARGATLRMAQPARWGNGARP